MNKLQKKYGEIQTDTGLEEFNSIIYFFSEQIPANSKTDKSQFTSKFIRETPEQFAFSNLRQLTTENAKVWEEINSSDISIPWVTPEGVLARKYYDIEPLKHDETQNEQLLPISPYRTVIREVGEIMLDEFNDHALKTVTFEQGGELYVGIKQWSRKEPGDAWREGVGIELDPAQLCLLAEHLNRAIQLIFLETKAQESEVESK